jgi:hypothetical protein
VPAIGVQHCLRDFAQRLQDALDLVEDAHNFRVIEPGGSYRYIGIRRVELFAGLALLRIHLAWETFLESVFIRYMCGATSATGFAPVLLLAPKPTIRAAMRDLLGPNLLYLNWTPSNTTRWANSHFDHGEPFTTTIGAVTQTLGDISAVRNSFAHRSGFAASEFRLVVLRAFGYMPRGISPGRFLLMVNPSPSSGGQKFLEFYANILLGAGLSIVP